MDDHPAAAVPVATIVATIVVTIPDDDRVVVELAVIADHRGRGAVLDGHPAMIAVAIGEGDAAREAKYESSQGK
jgi:hypothetical protein